MGKAVLYQVESIQGHVFIRGERHYIIKWKGYPSNQNTYEPYAHLTNVDEMVQEYEQSLTPAQLKMKQYKVQSKKRGRKSIPKPQQSQSESQSQVGEQVGDQEDSESEEKVLPNVPGKQQGKRSGNKEKRIKAEDSKVKKGRGKKPADQPRIKMEQEESQIVVADKTEKESESAEEEVASKDQKESQPKQRPRTHTQSQSKKKVLNSKLAKLREKKHKTLLNKRKSSLVSKGKEVQVKTKRISKKHMLKQAEALRLPKKKLEFEIVQKKKSGGPEPVEIIKQENNNFFVLYSDNKILKYSNLELYEEIYNKHPEILIRHFENTLFGELKKGEKPTK